MKSNFLVAINNFIDRKIKFPNLLSNEVAIQIGFDLSSKNLTTDLLLMCKNVGQFGTVIGIDPDPSNHEKIKEINVNSKLILIKKGTYNSKKKCNLILAKRASWNKLDLIDSDTLDKMTGRSIETELDTLDNIVEDLNLNIKDISHINITNNGAEYYTLLGMKNILENSENLSLTIIAGRKGKIGLINDQRDHEAITEYLSQYGFNTKFYRKSQLIWWGFFNMLLFKRINIFGKTPSGVIMAYKGGKKTTWYQSYS